MKTLLRNLLAVLTGFAVGSFVNMALILAGPHVISPPAGVNVASVESMRAHLHLFEARHFVFPFLAHALGAFAGAFIAFLVAASHRPVFAYTIGVLFLAGGITAAFMIPAPNWFVVLDLVAAYLPAAWLAIWIGRRCTRPAAPPTPSRTPPIAPIG